MLNTLAVTAAPRGIATLEVTSRAHWERLFAEIPSPHFPQSWVYGEGKRARGWAVDRLAFESHEGTVALCQVLVRRVLGMPLIARINRGPMFLPRGCSDEMHRAVF